MFDPKNVLLTKMDLLNISVEILIKEYTKKSLTKELKVIHNQIRHYKYKKQYNFTRIIEYIIHLKDIINRYYLDEIATEILKKYYYNRKCNIIKRYTDKFSYTCNTQKEYYQSNKFLYSISTLERCKVSIINLYIITKTKSINGTFILLKYLQE